MFASSQLRSTQTITDPAYKVADTGFDDSVSCIEWLPSDYADPSGMLGFVCSSWDSKVHFYGMLAPTSDYQPVGDIGRAIVTNTQFPVISLAVNSSSRQVAAGAIDGSVYLLDPVNNTILTIGKHEDAVKGVYFIEGGSAICCSVSYDKTFKLWDTRSWGSSPECSFNLPSKVVCSDMVDSKIALGFNNDKLLIGDVFDFHRITNFQDYCVESPLGNNSPLSAVSISKENVIGTGTCDGRANLSSFTRRPNGSFGLSNIVTFKAHKIDPGQGGNTNDLKILYPIHAVGLHPRNKDTYFTAGGDGSVIFWDIPARNKLATLSCHPAPITAAKWSSDGKYLAYAFGYDWAKGIEGAKSIPPKLHVHTMQPTEVVRGEI